MSDTEEYEELTFLDFARDGSKEPFAELFSEPDGLAKFLEIRDEYTQATPLHMCAANGHLELLEYLIDHLPAPEPRKQAVNVTNDSGNTAMHWAALTGSLEAVKLLYNAGADPLKKNLAGIDSCYQAESAGQEDVANFLYSVVDVDIDDDEKSEES